MRLEAGVVVGERYELVHSVASGGMGDVWRARDRVLGRSVAVKMMRPDVIAEPVFAERFHEEAILMAGLSHHNIATLFDYGTYEGIAGLYDLKGLLATGGGRYGGRGRWPRVVPVSG